MKGKIKRILTPGKRFKKEFRHEIRLFVNITFGFTIAFTWRQTFFDLSESFLQYLFHLKNNSSLTIFASIFITILSLIIISISSRYLKDDHECY